MGLFSGLIGNAGEVKKEDLQNDYGKLLIDGEEIEVGFKLIRDTFIWFYHEFNEDLTGQGWPPVKSIS